MHDRNIELKPFVIYFIHIGHFANEHIGLKESLFLTVYFLFKQTYTNI